MNNIFKTIGLSLILALAACKSVWVEERLQDEEISGIVFTQEDMYLLGKHSDYVFSIRQNKKKSDYPFDVADFQKFMQSPVREKITGNDLNITVLDGQNVYLSYEPTFRPPLNEEAKQILRQDKLYAVRGEWMRFSAKGKVVRLENKAQLPAAYLLKTPLPVQVAYKRTQNRFDGESLQSVGTLLALPVMLPATMVVWGVACIPAMKNNSGC
ncbi:hypothetical protein ACOR62_08345 [Neisseria lisongii]|uniref:Lipoprotein n=1 Tax=Neisseria lisongii TaxID=2912188 RepID=A0AAW5AFI5_9NEIS|nr:hypothetical protein [Neisseria lisongii]MCF7529800.1 hypothetical protein [Neisseria lisongii]